MRLIQFGVFASMLATFASSLSFSEINEDTSAPDATTDEERIYGGSDANAGKFPYLASLRSGGPYGDTFCGVLKLETPSTKKLAPLAAADGSNNPPGTVATVAGWGMVSNETDGLTLKSVDVEIISNEECDWLNNATVTSETVLCAGIGDGKGSCRGDSGGPLTANGVVVGIVSGGPPTDCGVSPGFYTRVSSVLDYIKDILGGGSTGNVTEFLTMPYNYSTDARPMPTDKH
ncbi:hypothetical protein PRIC1_011156 [Phytophthora ramorum]